MHYHRGRPQVMCIWQMQVRKGLGCRRVPMSDSVGARRHAHPKVIHAQPCEQREPR